jgi:hypothetical protein
MPLSPDPEKTFAVRRRLGAAMQDYEQRDELFHRMPPGAMRLTGVRRL